MKRALVGLVLAVALLASGCKSQQDSYCDSVTSHQEKLSETLGEGGPDALLRALPIFEDLAGDAPEDIRDDWKTVVDALQGLQGALKDAGVDPATYDRDKPPAGLSAKDEAAIDTAADRLGTAETVQAFNSVDQEAKDVCGTPLQVG